MPLGALQLYGSHRAVALHVRPGSDRRHEYEWLHVGLGVALLQRYSLPFDPWDAARFARGLHWNVSLGTTLLPVLFFVLAALSTTALVQPGRS